MNEARDQYLAAARRHYLAGDGFLSRFDWVASLPQHERQEVADQLRQLRGQRTVASATHLVNGPTRPAVAPAPPPDPEPTPRNHARIHEAGHAVIAWALGHEPSVVVVLSEAAGHARSLYPGPRERSHMSKAELDALLEAIAVADLAGEAALEVFGCPEPHDGAADDRGRAMEAARILDPKAPEAAFGRFYQRALALARERRDPIARLVATLAANVDRLAGREITTALEAAFAGWPTPRFDPESSFQFLLRRRALFEAASCPGDSALQRRQLWAESAAAARKGASPEEHREQAPIAGAGR